MGKNHGKKKAKTDLARWTSIMAKLDNQLAKEELERQKRRAERKNKATNKSKQLVVLDKLYHKERK